MHVVRAIGAQPLGKVVSKLLGHSSVLVTANVYSHALQSDESAAVEKWEAAQRAAGSKVVEMPLKKKQA